MVRPQDINWTGKDVLKTSCERPKDDYFPVFYLKDVFKTYTIEKLINFNRI